MAETVPFADDDAAESNLQRLIAMTRDANPVNRDWATLLLAQQDLDTPEVRAALLAAAEDDHAPVRAEAILGIAERDKALALPLLLRELARDRASMPIFEAAALVAHPSLVEDLRDFSRPSGNNFLDRLAREALSACEMADRTSRG